MCMPLGYHFHLEQLSNDMLAGLNLETKTIQELMLDLCNTPRIGFGFQDDNTSSAANSLP